ncbi:putative 5'-nucleotidase [Aspergillus lucknowensis]|uniref:5'-Nucleotidase C-terminal domain-containing protein n=1 Tax=Aspergillus lucknowensis TaxID=176173 RepID=A0ABR4M279_9EURO
MGKPPAAIFIARHGARLDAANKEWHLTSATPYDPPLSYGGWLQSRALGARIISELRSLEHQPDRSAQGAQDPKTQPHRLQERKQKRRIIIHTSPFLRCVQTAIAISSGISQNHPGIDSPHPARIPRLDQSGTATTLPQPISSPRSAPPQGNHRCLLRVDACLGEWLSPNYFENITPPPKSERMVTTAKTELLRRDRSVIPSADTQNTPSVGHFPGGWSNTVTNPVETGSSEVDQASTMANGTGQRNRAGSYDSFGSGGTGWGRKILKINTDLPSEPDTAYTPPIPSYAISTSSPIPDGYVTHARDACVSVDYQWDSMREPQNWGTGGEYGEEWSTMHSRFKTGLERMISWYQDDDSSTAPPRRRSRSQLRFLDQDEAEDSAVNTILILVTHGAGCNALIGAISGGPALVDVNTASLTLAVRKDCLNNTTQDGEEGKQHDSLTKSNGFENYQLVEVASTDHLRPGTSPSTSARSSSISSLPSPSIPSYRHRSAEPSCPPLSFIPARANMPSIENDGLTVTYSSERTGIPDLRLLHYNDVYHVESGSAEPVGGAPRFQSVVNHYRSHPSFDGHPNLLTFFSGDAFNPSLESTVTKGRHMVPFLNRAGTDVACVGNHDLDFGVAQFRHLRGQCQFPWLLANVLDPALGEDVPIGNCDKTCLLTSSNGVKVGVIGLGEREWLGTINSLPPDLVYKSASKTAIELVPRLREQGAEIIVAVTHQREPNDNKLAENIPYGLIDIILGGHDHYYNHTLINGVHVLRSGTDFKQLSYIEAFRRRDGPGWDFNIIRRDILRSIPEDPSSVALVAKLTSSLKAKLDKPIGYTVRPLDGRFSTVRAMESNLGNFACDLMRFYYRADCAMMAGGTIRGDQIYPPGVLRLRDILNCFPFEDPVVLLRLKGKALLGALENGVSQLPALEGRFTQVSNITFSFNPSAPPGSRINWAKVGDYPVDSEQSYTLATRGYMARGKDGFTSLLVQSEGGEVEEIVDEESGTLISTLMRQYFLSLKVMGRWQHLGKSMTRHWAEVQKNMQNNGFLKPPSALPSPEQEKASSRPQRPPLNRKTKYYYGRFAEPETTSEESGEPGIDESVDSDSDSDPEILISPKPITNYVTLPARSAEDEEHRLRLARWATRRWMHRTGIHSTVDDTNEDPFTPAWTPGIAPRLEGRIIIEASA